MNNFFKSFNPRLALSLTLFVLVAGFVLAVRIRHENKYEKILQQMELSQVESIYIYANHDANRTAELSDEDKVELISLLNQAKMKGDEGAFNPQEWSGHWGTHYHIQLKNHTEFDFAASGLFYTINRTTGYNTADREVSIALAKKYKELWHKYFPDV